MSDYIEREAVNALIKAECSPKVAAYLIDAVAAIPAADVRPVVTCERCVYLEKELEIDYGAETEDYYEGSEDG